MLFNASMIAGNEGSQIGFSRDPLEVHTHRPKNVQAIFAATKLVEET